MYYLSQERQTFEMLFQNTVKFHKSYLLQQSFSKNKLSFYFRFKGFLVHTVLTSKIS